MPSPTLATQNLTTAEFIAKCRDVMIPLDGSMAYFSVLPLDRKDSERLVYDPTSSFPPRLAEVVPKLRLVLVPYLAADPGNAKSSTGFRIAFEPPADGAKRYTASVADRGENYIFLAIRDEELFDAHILLYTCLAQRIVKLLGEGLGTAFYRLLDAELKAKARGEVNEDCWRLKNELLRCRPGTDNHTSVLERYRRQALEDTLALYLHGLCCDIDIEVGPKQLPSKHVRKRLLALKEQLPPPDGVALFPEDLKAVD